MANPQDLYKRYGINAQPQGGYYTPKDFNSFLKGVKQGFNFGDSNLEGMYNNKQFTPELRDSMVRGVAEGKNFGNKMIDQMTDQSNFLQGYSDDKGNFVDPHHYPELDNLLAQHFPNYERRDFHYNNSQEADHPLFNDSHPQEQQLTNILASSIQKNFGGMNSSMPTIEGPKFSNSNTNPTKGKSPFVTRPQPAPATQGGSAPSKGIRDYGGPIKNLIAKYAAQFGIAAYIPLAVAEAESGFNQKARSPVGAIGVMQLMPATARGLGVDPYTLEGNIKGGVKLLAQLWKTYGGNYDKVFAAYNAGPGAVAKYGGVPPYKETKTYVVRVRGNMKKYT